MRSVQSKPNEFLVVGRRGKLRDLGLGSSAVVWPWTSFVTVSAARREAPFELTQETRDGIPLRMKGVIVYRVVDAVAVAARFDFSGDGHAAVASLLAHVALGELRAVATLMTMKECIEQRKTVLTGAVASALTALVEGGAWGLALEVVQVAQVFIVDVELRKKLEAEVRSQLSTRSALAEIRMKEESALAEIRMKEKVAAAEAAARRAELERRREAFALEAEVSKRRAELRETEVEGDLALDRAKQRLRLEALPIEQVPQIAQALGQAYQGAQLSVYGADAAQFAGLAPLVDMVAAKLAPTRT